MKSNFLLSIFIWVWLIASVGGTVGAVAGMLDLPIHESFKTDIPTPSWALPAHALIFFAYFVSIIAISSEKDWGVSLFIAATVAIVAVELASGVPITESIRDFINVVVLIVLLALDERGETSDQDLEKTHALGLDKELRNPAEALKIYDLFEEKNITRNLPLFFVSILSLPIAYVITFYVNQRIEQHQYTVAIVLMCLLGMGPIVFLNNRRMKEQNKQLDIRPVNLGDDSKVLDFFFGVWGWGWLLLIALFADAFMVIIMALMTAVIVYILLLPYNLWLVVSAGQPFVLGLPESMPLSVVNALTIAIFIVIFIITVSEVHLKPFSLSRILREIPANIKENGDRIFSFLVNISLTVVLFGVVRVKYDVIYEDIQIGIIVYAFLGSLIGWDFYREKKNLLLGMLNSIAQVRCLARMGKKTVGQVKLQRAQAEMKGQPEPYQSMAWAISIYLRGDKRSIARKELFSGMNALNVWDTQYYDLCKIGLEHTGDLIE